MNLRKIILLTLAGIILFKNTAFAMDNTTKNKEILCEEDGEEYEEYEEYDKEEEEKNKKELKIDNNKKTPTQKEEINIILNKIKSLVGPNSELIKKYNEVMEQKEKFNKIKNNDKFTLTDIEILVETTKKIATMLEIFYNLDKYHYFLFRYKKYDLPYYKEDIEKLKDIFDTCLDDVKKFSKEIEKFNQKSFEKLNSFPKTKEEIIEQKNEFLNCWLNKQDKMVEYMEYVYGKMKNYHDSIMDAIKTHTTVNIPSRWAMEQHTIGMNFYNIKNYVFNRLFELFNTTYKDLITESEKEKLEEIKNTLSHNIKDISENLTKLMNKCKGIKYSSPVGNNIIKIEYYLNNFLDNKFKKKDALVEDVIKNSEQFYKNVNIIKNIKKKFNKTKNSHINIYEIKKDLKKSMILTKNKKGIEKFIELKSKFSNIKNLSKNYFLDDLFGTYIEYVNNVIKKYDNMEATYEKCLEILNEIDNKDYSDNTQYNIDHINKYIKNMDLVKKNLECLISKIIENMDYLLKISSDKKNIFNISIIKNTYSILCNFLYNLNLCKKLHIENDKIILDKTNELDSYIKYFKECITELENKSKVITNIPCNKLEKEETYKYKNNSTDKCSSDKNFNNIYNDMKSYVDKLEKLLEENNKNISLDNTNILSSLNNKLDAI